MHEPPTRPLLPFPAQPDGVPWPTETWPTADPADASADAERLDRLLAELFEPEVHPTLGRTYAVGVVVGGRLVAERYGRRVVQDLRSLAPDPPFDDLGPDDELLSWSIAKSITHLLVGMAVADGALSVDDPVRDPRWTAEDDERAGITWDHLLSMRPGLAWVEEYYDLGGEMPDVVTMLFGEPAGDAAAYAAAKPLATEPGSAEAYTYSSGTTNIVTNNLQRLLGLDRDGTEAFIADRLASPIGATLRASFDEAGTFLGSSYVHATLRDWCRFGLLALRGGEWDGQRLVPEGWLDHGRRPRSWDEYLFHGAHWWAWDDEDGAFGAHGFEGQRVIAFPNRDVVVARFGHSDQEAGPDLNAHLAEIARCFPPA